MSKTDTPTIEDIANLNGAIFALLSPTEMEAYRYFRDQGRKFGVTVSLTTDEADPAELSSATSQTQYEGILRHTNARLVVDIKTIGNLLDASHAKDKAWAPGMPDNPTPNRVYCFEVSVGGYANYYRYDPAGSQSEPWVHCDTGVRVDSPCPGFTVEQHHAM